MVGHEDIAEDVKGIFAAGLLDDLLEGVAGFGGLQDVGVAVAADGDEVEVSGLVVTREALWHGVESSGGGPGGEWHGWAIEMG